MRSGPRSPIGAAGSLRRVATIAAAAVLASCTADMQPTAVSSDPLFNTNAGDGGGQVLLCKYTPTPTSEVFDFEVDATGGRVPGNGRFSLAATQSLDGTSECAVIWRATGDRTETLTVTEDAPLGWDLYAIYDSDHGFVEPVTNPYSVTVGPSTDKIIVFKNQPGEIDMTPGRMTGGGGQFNIDGVYITRGFTIHCDITLSNNVEVNWEGNRWHIDKPLTSAVCIDDPGVEPAPPPAPFDTFIGEAFGRLNGVDGSFIRFTFVDTGERGGKHDSASIRIWAPGADPDVDAPVLVVDGELTNGNLQAHYDQPHR